MKNIRPLTALSTIFGLLVAAVVSLPAPAWAADESLSVNFSASAGTPTYRASGWIYGMTEDASGPPDHFFTDVKFRYMRAGGAQLDSPGGWVSGRYDRRWTATRAQLLRTRALGGDFVLLVHDLWGADGYPISRFPGDNGNWTDYDAFLARVVSDVRRPVLRCSGTSGTSRTSHCSGTVRRRSTSSCGGVPTSACALSFPVI